MHRKLFLLALLTVIWLAGQGCDDATGPSSNAAFEVLSEGGLTVKFRNLSSGACCYRWDFGDFTPPSFQDEPIHTFALAGDYVVLLMACPRDDFDSSNCSRASAVVTVTEGGAAIHF